MRDCLIRLDGLSEAIFGGEDDTMKGQAVDKLEVELSTLGEIQGRDTELLLSLADRGC